jgi:DNA-binding NarL/FixJ family response regulator
VLRVVIADDHALMVSGLESLLHSEPGFEVVGKANTAADALALTRVLRPDVLLLDVSMPTGSGLEVLDKLVRLPGVSVLLLTAGIDEESRARAFRLGVRGIILKDAATEFLFDGIRAVASGKYWLWRAPTSVEPDLPVPPAAERAHRKDALTQREREVLAALLDGCSTNRDIATRLAISEDTVKHHMSSLFDKTGASSRVGLALFAVQRRLLDA